MVLVVLLMLGIVFRTYVYDLVAAPLAMLLMLAGRIINSVDQAAYWGALVAAVAVWMLTRLGRTLVEMPAIAGGTPSARPDTAVENVLYWQRQILVGSAANGRVRSAAGRFAGTARRALCVQAVCEFAGGYVFDSQQNRFVLRQGPLFTHVLLADEINRASPKTQSALLEAMQEGQVTLEGTTLPLPAPFIVIATQNPIEYEGTFPLPEAQLDRCMIRLSIGYPDPPQGSGGVETARGTQA